MRKFFSSALLCLPVSIALPASAQTVEEAADARAGECSSEGVEGLSAQLVETHRCRFPRAFLPFAPHPQITLSSDRVHPLADPQAQPAIVRAAENQPLTVTSAFRTVVEQLVLQVRGGCGLVARPGSSQHQGARAIDVANYNEARDALEAEGCIQTLPEADPVHFECPGVDSRNLAVLVFQQLWNYNVVSDSLDEDGIYGPQTEARLRQSPAAGFPGTPCGFISLYGARWTENGFVTGGGAGAGISGDPGEVIEGFLEFENVGSDAWDEEVVLITAEPPEHESEFADASWQSRSVVGAIDGSVLPGQRFRFEFNLALPQEGGEYEVFFALKRGETLFSDPGQLGPSIDGVRVPVRVRSSEVVDAGVSDAGDREPPAMSGCTVGRFPRPNPATVLGVMVFALLAQRRRRRATTT